MIKKLTTLTEESKQAIENSNFLLPILQEIEQSVIDIKNRLDNLENKK